MVESLLCNDDKLTLTSPRTLGYRCARELQEQYRSTQNPRDGAAAGEAAAKPPASGRLNRGEPMHRGWMSRVRAGAAMVTAVGSVMGALVWSTAWADVGYVYDELGRLMQAVAPDGSSVLYSYDAAGNISSIRKTAAGALSLAEFTPNGGPGGTVVKIYGTGFSVTPGNNTVRFNGSAATVNTASATSLTVVVPAGATTGKITVSNTNGSVTSAVDYVVGTIVTAPTVTGFTPAIGTADTEITVTGTNFQLSSADNKVSIGSRGAAVSKDATSPTATSLKLRVPSAGASGKITVTTPYGKAVSTEDFFSLPSGVNAADVQFRGRLVIDGAPLTVTTTTAGKMAALVFDAPSGTALHFLSSAGTFASPFWAGVFQHDGTQLEMLMVTNNGVVDFAGRTPVAGTYTVLLVPGATDRGTLQLGLVSGVTGTLAVDGSTPVSLSPGRNARYSFAAEAGNGYALALTSLVLTPSNHMNVTLRHEDGTSRGTCSSNNGLTCDFAPEAFATSGTYYLDFDPQGVSAATFNAVLSKEISGPIAVDGAATTVPIAREGQNARFTFNGTAGQPVSVVLTGNTLDDGNPAASYGTWFGIDRLSSALPIRVTSATIPSGTAGAILDVTLPETSAYTLFINPDAMDKGTIAAQIKSYATGTLAADSSTTLDLSAGRNARLTFTAEANQGYGLALTSLSTTPAGGTVNVTLKKADGTTLTSCSFRSSNSCDLAPTHFATAGTYLLDVDPANMNAAVLTVLLSKNLGGTLTVDAAPTTANLVHAGQNARYTFSGTAGQVVSVVLTGNTLDDGNPATSNSTWFGIYKPSSPNSSAIASATIASGTTGATLNATLPETGTYTLGIFPVALDKGAIAAELKSYVTGTLAADSSTTLDLSVGRNARLTITAEANQGYGLALTSLSTTPSGGTVSVALKKADGTNLTSCSFNSRNSCDLAPTYFAITGTYLLDVDPAGMNAAALTVLLSKNLGGTLIVDAAPTTANFAHEGQNARYTFSGTAGQQVSVVLTGNTLDDGNPATSNSTWFGVYKPSSPNSSAIASATIASGTAGATLNATLTETGTYTLGIHPVALDKGSVGIQVRNR